MRRSVGVAVVAAAVLLLSACAPSSDRSWTPPAWPASPVTVIDHAAPPVDTATVEAITPHRLRNDAVGIQARFVSLPGAGGAVAAFNSAVDDVIRAAIAERSSASGVAYEPVVFDRGARLSDRGCVMGSTLLAAADILSNPAFGPAGGAGTAVVCDIVMAAGPMFAQRIRAVSGSSKGVTTDSARILYVDTASGETVDASALWAEGAAAELRIDVVEAIRRAAGGLSLAPAQAVDDAQTALIAQALATTVPGTEGALVFTVPPGFSAPELDELGMQATTEPMTIEVPADVVAQLASPFGQRVSAAEGAGYEGPARVAPGAEWIDCTLVPCVALTYDDGPSSFTPTLLDEFADLRVAATFYLLGQSAAGRPDDVRRMAAEGHQVGNHTWNHPSLPTLTAEEVAGQVSRTRDLLRELSGQPVATFRPPYGEYNPGVLAAAQVPAILWSVDTMDWAGPEDAELLESGIDDPRPGGIVLFHDTHERSVRLAPAIVKGLRERGFTLATIDQLFGGAPPPGAYRWAG